MATSQTIPTSSWPGVEAKVERTFLDFEKLYPRFYPIKERKKWPVNSSPAGILICNRTYIPSAYDFSKMLGCPPAGHNEFCTTVYANHLAFGKCGLLSLRGPAKIVEMLRK